MLTFDIISALFFVMNKNEKREHPNKFHLVMIEDA